MNFLHLDYWPGLLLAAIVFAFTVFLLEKSFYSLIRKYWFYKRSLFSYLSSLCLISGMTLLLFSILDARGPEERIKTPVPRDRTIILIDTSASMLAEDVKPSRLQKAALIAKHFARKAAGHQLSVVAFAEIQKKIVPFTNDLDLIDARLDSIKSLRNQYGSSALSVAIQESIQYFKESGGEARGNILVLTDGEETAEGIKLNIPKEYHVALVGIGTTQGGRIPLDDSRGFRFGYKRDKGRDIITKLNEKFFQKTAADIPSGKYWLANTYSLPSEEIVEFFQTEKSKGMDEQDMVIRPVMMEWIVLPAIVLLILSYIFKAIRIFSLGLLLLLYNPAYSQEKEDVQLTPEVISQMQSLEKGELNKIERLKLADDLYRAGAKDEAISMFEENLKGSSLDQSVPPEAYLNYGTTLLEKGKTEKALGIYQTLMDGLEGEKKKEFQETIEKNIVTHFKQQEEKKEQEKKDKKDKKDNKDNKDNKDQKPGQGSPKPEEGKSGDQKKPQDNPEDKKEEKKDKNDPGKDKEEPKDEPEDKKDQPGDAGEEEKKPLPPKKLEPKLKQLMSDDRQLQLKMIENGTRDLNRRKSRSSKDW